MRGEGAICLHDLQQALVVAVCFSGVWTIPLCPTLGTSTLCYCCLTDLHSRAPSVTVPLFPWQQHQLKQSLVKMDVFINQTARDRVTQSAVILSSHFWCV